MHLSESKECATSRVNPGTNWILGGADVSTIGSSITANVAPWGIHRAGHVHVRAEVFGKSL
jgi:hypothetical protein